MRRYAFLASAALIAGATPSFAQSAPADNAGSNSDAAADADERDAIVVTGTLIRRSEYQLASPVDTVKREELEARVPNNMAEFVKDLPGNFGSAFASGRAFGNERGAGTINLRGLGASATLVLVNSRRQTQLPDAADNVVDVNSLIPEIMLERVEILKDGASALYGSDAVAGVVNFITNDRFSGVKLSARGNMFTYSEAKDYRIEGLFGTDLGSRFHAVLGLGYYSQDPINGYAYTTPSQPRSTLTDLRFTSPSSWPGEFVVPRRNAGGVLLTGTGSTTANVVDPTCGTVVSSFPTTTVGGLPVLASSPAAGVDCRYNFWGDNGSQSEITRYQAMLRLTGDLTDSIRFDGEAAYTHIKSATAYTAGDTLASAVTIPGHNPGNIYYRAVNASGQPLYAVSSGVSAGYVRDGATVFLPSRTSAGQVILAPNPTDPTSGIPFYEDVSFSGRPLGSTCGLPSNSVAPGECAWSRPSLAENDIFRIAGGLSGDITEKWNWRVGAAYSRYALKTNGTVGVALVNELNFGLAGLGGANCNRAANTPGQNGCQYFNLFGNSALAAPGSAQANSQGIIDYVMPFLNDKYTSSLFTVEGVVSGELFELPAGPLAIAAGYQYRHSTLAIDYDVQANQGNKANGVTQADLNRSRGNHAFFAEAVVPIFNSAFGYLEFDGAIRHEKIGDTLSTTNPKLGLLFNTQDKMISVRASYGTSFIAPSLFRLYADSASGTAVNDCPASQGAPCRGDLNLRIALLQKGNPFLRPERSKSYSAGFTFRPTRNITFDLTWWRFEFEDKIVTPSATEIVAANPNGTALTPVVRDVTGRLVSVTTVFSNAASVVTNGFDFSADWRFGIGSAGDMNINLNGTYIHAYDYQAVAGGPVIKAAGATNDNLVPPPNTKFRLNTRVTWRKDGHLLNVIGHYYAPIDFTRTPGTKIGAWFPIDVNYSYEFDLGGAKTLLGVGAQNVFGAKEPFVPVPGFQPFVPSLYDTRGRSVYVKLGVEF